MNLEKISRFIDFVEKNDISFQRDALLADFTTFRLGGQCPCLVFCDSSDQLARVVKELASHDLPYLLVGGGSNLLVSDDGLDAIVVRYVSDTVEMVIGKDDVSVSAAVILDDFVDETVYHGINGFVNCSGIPGTVGGAIVGNAGAFGWQIGDAVISVTVINKHGELEELIPDDIGFRYRHSGLKVTKDIVVDAKFTLKKSDREALQTERNRILKLRASKHPDLKTYSCAGSFFKNIEPTSAADRRQASGWFLEQAGVKAMQFGGAGIFSKHANIIIQSTKNCSARDVYELSKQMALAVKNKYGIDLEREVLLIGRFKNFEEN